MFDFIRHHRRWMQLILLILIVPSFFLVGLHGYESFMAREPALATVADQPITRSEFNRAWRNQLDQLRQRLGSQFDPAVVDTPAVRQRLLQQLIDQRLLLQVADDNRFSVSDETLRNTIAAIPQPQDNGRFSPERYRQVLAAQGMSPALFEAGMRRDLAVARVLDPISQTARVPATVITLLENALTQKRTVSVHRYNAADYRAKVVVTPADIQAWYDANKPQLRIPEQAQVQYLVLDKAAAMQGIQVTEEEELAYYEENKSRFNDPERRRASHIMVEVPADASETTRRAAREKAQALARQAAANPAQFAELARQHSQDAGSAGNGGDMGWLAQGTWSGPLEQSIFSLNKNQISDVVETPSGFHIIKVTEIHPARTKSLTEVRGQIAEEIRTRMAASRFADIATRLTKLVYDQRDSLQPAADALGLELRTAAGMTREGLLPADQVGAGAAAASADAALLNNPRVRQVIFSPEVLQEKQNSGVIELAPDTLCALRVVSMQEAHVPSLEKISASIRTRLLNERAAEEARKAGAEALQALQAQHSASVIGFDAAIVVSRKDPKDLPRPILDAVMRMPSSPLPAYAGIAIDNDYAVVRLQQVEQGASDPAMQAILSQELAGEWGEVESGAALKMLREQYKVTLTPEADRIIQGKEGQSDHNVGGAL
jgi:peptidyl-prolyl cis-trans isomerase D